MNLLTHTGIYAVGLGLEKGLNFIMIPIYTAILMPEALGIIAMMTVTVGFIRSFTFAPENIALSRFYYYPELEERRQELTFSLFGLVLLKAFICSLCFLVLAKELSRILLDNEKYYSLIHLYAIVIFLSPLSQYFNSLLILEQKSKISAFVSVFKLVASTLVLLLLLLVFDKGLYALAIGDVLIATIPFVVLSPYFLSRIVMKITIKEFRPVLKYGYSLLILPLSMFIIQLSDRYVLRVFMDLSDIGIYNVGYMIAAIITLFFTPLNRAIYPMLYKMEKNEDELRKFTKRATTYFYFIMVWLSIAITMFSYELVTLIVKNEEFWSGWVVVPFIAFAYGLHGMLDLFGRGLLMAKKTFYINFNVIASALINIILNVIFIPKYGILGAALATIISYIIWTTLSMYYSKIYYDLHYEYSRLLHITAIGVLIILIPKVLHFNTISVEIISKIMLLGAYPLLAYVTGFYTRNERKSIYNAVNNAWNAFNGVVSKR